MSEESKVKHIRKSGRGTTATEKELTSEYEKIKKSKVDMAERKMETTPTEKGPQLVIKEGSPCTDKDDD